MKQITVNGHLLVEVPDDYFYEETLNIDEEPDEDGNQWLCYQIPDGFSSKSNCIKIPNGKYQYIGKAEDATEEQWAEIVDITKDEFGWVDYTKGQFYYDKATESGLSLLKKYSLSPEETVIVKLKP